MRQIRPDERSDQSSSDFTYVLSADGMSPEGMELNDSENLGRLKDERPKHPVIFPDLRSVGVRQPIILVADDEVMVRNLVTILMQTEGYFVLAAADGHEALELSRKYPGTIHLVITDVQMPRLNGTDLCARLLEERPGIKVLVMSGADMTEIVSQNVNLPFLPKPFDGETLKARVRAILAPPVQPTKHKPI
jgi:CheY-like chemotaxis protein